MLLQRPDEAAPSSRLADWLELLAAAQPNRAFGGGELVKIIRVEGEERRGRRVRDATSGDIEEREITEPETPLAVNETFAELLRRQALLRESYPFIVETEEVRVGTRNRLRWREGAENDSGAAAYLYCLLISGIRNALLAMSAEDEKKLSDDGLKAHSEYKYGLLLQICAAIALGGYLHGDVVSFGYPRPDGSAFLEAHQKTWERFGAYKPVSNVPLGAPDQENDAGVDLIGWLSFPDLHASKVLVIGQVASGRNWAGKSALDRANALKSWFDSPAFQFFIPAMVMPFNITDARKTVKRGDGDLRKAIFEIEERQFGIVLDRDRVAACVAEASGLSRVKMAGIEGLEQLPRVRQWVQAALLDLRDDA